MTGIPPEVGDALGVPEASAALGIPQRTLRHHLMSGTIRGRQGIGGYATHWLIPATEVQRIAKLTTGGPADWQAALAMGGNGVG